LTLSWGREFHSDYKEVEDTEPYKLFISKVNTNTYNKYFYKTKLKRDFSDIYFIKYFNMEGDRTEDIVYHGFIYCLGLEVIYCHKDLINKKFNYFSDLICEGIY